MKSKSFVVDGIEKRYGRHQCLDGASFSCEKGKCIGIVGVNGSGKSTLLSTIAGIHKADRGSVYIDGTDILKNKKFIGKYIGYVPQENPLIEDLTVLDNIKLWYCDSVYDMKRELEEGFLKMLGIDLFKDKLVGKLSGGMKKRVSVGIAMHNAPKILLLDEMGAALDMEAKKDIKDYLKSYLKSGGIVVLVSHDEYELDMCDEIYVMNNGKLREIDRSLRGDELLYEMTGKM